jgi:hypothetical protein
MNGRRIIWAVLLTILVSLTVSGCAANSTAHSDYDDKVKFSNYQSFAWLSENPMKVAKVVSSPKTTLQPAIMAAIRTHLESAGYEYASVAAEADFLLSFTVGSREKIDRESYPSMSSGPVGRGGWATAYYGGGSAAAYTQGILAIDIFDAAEQRPVWHGVHGKKITAEDRADMDAVIDAAVASILANFPPN